AEALGIAFGKVQATFADTATTPFAHSTSGSTTTFTSGLAALQAAEDAKRGVLETAARLLEVKPNELKLADGFVSVMDAPEIRIPLGHVIRRNQDQVVIGKASLRSGSKTHIINSFAAHFADLEVDHETGSVRVLRYVAVHDSGRIIHPEAARGQIMGGVVQGLGYALMEEIPIDPESGAPLTLNLDSFKIPNLMDIPPIEPVLIEHPDPVGPYGAKALGADRRPGKRRPANLEPRFLQNSQPNGYPAHRARVDRTPRPGWPLRRQGSRRRSACDCSRGRPQRRVRCTRRPHPRTPYHSGKGSARFPATGALRVN